MAIEDNMSRMEFAFLLQINMLVTLRKMFGMEDIGRQFMTVEQFEQLIEDGRV